MEQDKKHVKRRAWKKESIILNILPDSVAGDQAAPTVLEQAVPTVSREDVSTGCWQPAVPAAEQLQMQPHTHTWVQQQ